MDGQGNVKAGIKLSHLYGGWDTGEFSGALPFGDYYAVLVAVHAADCITDPIVGRVIPALFYPQDGSFDSIKDSMKQMIRLKRAMILIQARFDENSRVQFQSTKDELLRQFYRAQVKIYEAVRFRSQWIVDIHNKFLLTAGTFRSIAITSKALFTGFVKDNPRFRRVMIRRLAKETEDLLNSEYARFFGPNKIAALRSKLDQVVDLERESDYDALEKALEEWTEEIESAINKMFDDNLELRTIATQLKFIYGGENLSDRDKFTDYFGVSPFSDYIENIEHNPEFWINL